MKSYPELMAEGMKRTLITESRFKLKTKIDKDFQKSDDFKEFKKDIKWVETKLPALIKKAHIDLERSDDPDDEEEILAIDKKYARQCPFGCEEVVDVAQHFEDEYGLTDVADEIRNYIEDEWYA